MSSKVRLKKIQRFITRMPSLSTTVTKVLEICNSPEASPSDLNRVISYDPVLSGQLLKLINSAYYGFASEINSLTRAIIMLGVNTVKHMALTTTILASMKGHQMVKKINIDAFWAHSLCVAVVAKAIAKEQKVLTTDLEGYFLAGLMHDLGKIPMMATFPDYYCQAVESSHIDDLNICEAERLHLGFDHCQIGRLISAKWQLGHNMLQSIGNHHQMINIEKSPSAEWLYTAMANQLANKFNLGAMGNGRGDTDLFNELLKPLGRSPQLWFEMEPHIADEIEKAKVFMQIAGKG